MEANGIEPNNREITNELAKVERVNCQGGTSNKDLRSQSMMVIV